MENLTEEQNESLSALIEKLISLPKETTQTETTQKGFTRSETRHLMLSPKFSRCMPKAFKDELRARGKYQENRYTVHCYKKAITQNGGGSEISYYVIMYSRLRNADGKKIGTISGSGATLEEASNAFIEALRAVKLPPQE